jgi:Response regulator containing a CheY-like receiver domain and an HTH DNA-binding domain
MTYNKVISKLTRKEARVAKLIVEGFSNREIAKELAITERTVKGHLNNIYKKLGLKSRYQLMVVVLMLYAKEIKRRARG